jgi:propanediol dehydratase large subunit
MNLCVEKLVDDPMGGGVDSRGEDELDTAMVVERQAPSAAVVCAVTVVTALAAPQCPRAV